jgi:hypothetical protein
MTGPNKEITETIQPAPAAEQSTQTLRQVYVESVRKEGFDLFIRGTKVFVAFDQLPVFKEVQIQDIFDVDFFGEDALEWESADIHIPIDALYHPEKYTWRFPAGHVTK